MSVETAYLRAILGLLARKTLPHEELRKLVAPRGKGGKQVIAYNLCDGTNTQAEIAKKAKFDTGNLSKTLTRWEAEGIVIRAEHPIHLYPLNEE